MSDDYYYKFDNEENRVYYILRTEDKNIPIKYENQVLSLFGKQDMTVAHSYIKSKDFDKYIELYQNVGISVFKVVV